MQGRDMPRKNSRKPVYGGKKVKQILSRLRDDAPEAKPQKGVQ